jgi:hypothetical protein
MTTPDEIDLWMAMLIEAWGPEGTPVEINCDGHTCVVEDELGFEKYEAATLTEALRLSAADVEAQP